MRLSLAILLSSFLLTSCWSHPAPVLLTETRGGEVITTVPIAEVSARSDVPVGIAPRYVVAKIETKTGAKVYLVKKPFKAAVAYQNAEAKKEGLTITQPKNPWWKWPAILGGIILLMAVFWMIGILKGWIKGVMWWKFW